MHTRPVMSTRREVASDSPGRVGSVRCQGLAHCHGQTQAQAARGSPALTRRPGQVSLPVRLSYSESAKMQGHDSEGPDLGNLNCS